MYEKTITVVNRSGLHARPSSVLVEKTKDFKSSIYFQCGSNTINAKSILGIITLGAAYGNEIKIIAEGEDEEAAVEALAHVFESKFQEE
ncbi:MAG: HPr family phosphocarrier protein [Spirochaetaceae bacterium]|jgi:phosphocarrier protein|nr:HPr family phosphocarrier protein [Spirochaetaceae bacterium]